MRLHLLQKSHHAVSPSEAYSQIDQQKKSQIAGSDLSKVLGERLLLQLIRNVVSLEVMTIKEFGSAENPLTVSVRSGAPASMPGMMDTILNVGITDETLPGLIEQIGELPAWKNYAQLYKSYGLTVLGISKEELEQCEQAALELIGEADTVETDPVSRVRNLVEAFKKIIPLPQDVYEQLQYAILGVWASYDSPGATYFRAAKGYTQAMGTAVIVQEMVYSNNDRRSFSGVLFSSDRNQGMHNRVNGAIAWGVQGEAVVSGENDDSDFIQTKNRLMVSPAEPYTAELLRTLNYLESKVKLIEMQWGHPVDVEFTAVWDENLGKYDVYFLQARLAKLSAEAQLRGIEQWEAYRQQQGADATKAARAELSKIKPSVVESIAKSRFKDDSIPIPEIGRGEPNFHGAATGAVYFTPDTASEALRRGESVVLLSEAFDPNQVGVLLGGESGNRVRGVILTKGSTSSHMAQVLTACEPPVPGIFGFNKGRCIFEQNTATLNSLTLTEGSMVSIDSDSGRVFVGERQIVTAETPREIALQTEKYVSIFGRHNNWLNALPEARRLELDIELTKMFWDTCQQRWQSPKAAQTELMGALFAEFEGLMLPFTLIRMTPQAQETKDEALERVREQLRNLRETARSKNFSLHPRTSSMRGLKTPYLSADAAKLTDEVFEQWLVMEELSPELQKLIQRLQKAKKEKNALKKNDFSPSERKLLPLARACINGTLSQWVEIEGIPTEALVCLHNPHDLLVLSKQHDKFTAVMRATPEEIEIKILDGNILMRTNEEDVAARILQIHYAYGQSGEYGIVRFEWQKQHFSERKLHALLNQINNPEFLNPKMNKLAVKLRRTIDGFNSTPPNSYKATKKLLLTAIERLSEQGELSDEELYFILNERTAELLQFINRQFKDLFERGFIQKAAIALAATGACAWEFQGQMNAARRIMFLYGQKGIEELQMPTGSSQVILFTSTVLLSQFAGDPPAPEA